MPPTLLTLDPADAVTASGDHPLVAQYAPHLVPGRPAWRYAAAIGVVYDYWGHQDLAVVGPDADAAGLARSLGEELALWASMPLSAAALLPSGFLLDPHEWELRWVTAPVGEPPDAARWLRPEEYADVAALLDVAFTDASTRPGSPLVRRWAGIRDPDGRLVACAADTTGNPTLGFVASITTLPGLRGGGLGRRVTGWVLDRLVAEHGRAALWLNGDNAPAIAVYDRLRMSRLRLVAGALPAAHEQSGRHADARAG